MWHTQLFAVDSVTFVSPKPYQRYTNGTTSIPIKITSQVSGGFIGGYRYRVGTPFPTSGAAGGTTLNVNTTVNVTVTNALTQTIYIVLVDSNGNVFSPSVSNNVMITVEDSDLTVGSTDIYTFTNAGQTGNTGPSQTQINTAYTGTTLQGKVTVTSGIQYFTVPKTGGYRIETYGARGGTVSQKPGGYGAVMKGTFNLTQGAQLKILVGQAGASKTVNTDWGAGGGGGTFVTLSDNTPLIIAGGGAGAGDDNTLPDSPSGTNLAISNGSITTSGKTSSSGKAGGTSGGGGLNDSNAGGGGGLLTNGQGGGYAGTAFVNGGNGNAGGAGMYGGFGGGAGTWDGGGGGGGYSGGSAANVGTSGGGGSYNNGTNQENTEGGNPNSMGQVIIKAQGVDYYNLEDGKTRTITQNISLPTKDIGIGFFNTGKVIVSNGVTVMAKSIQLGMTKGTTGEFVLSHSSAVVTASESLIVGQRGTATFTQSAGTLFVPGKITIAKSSDGTGTFTLSGGTLIAKILEKGSGTGSFTFTGGTLKVVTVNMSLTNTSGTFSPGQSPAISIITGNYTQGSGATLVMELGGTTPGSAASNYDQLVIKRNASLGGTLTVTAYNGFVPVQGQSFQILKVSGSTSGTFSTVNLPSLSAGLGWNTSTLYSAGTISVVLDPNGDSDSDGYINSVDAYPYDPARHVPGIDFVSPTPNYAFSGMTTKVAIKANWSGGATSGLLAYTVNQPFETGSRTILSSGTSASFNVTVTTNAAYTVRLGMVTAGGAVISTVDVVSIQFKVTKATSIISAQNIPGLRLWFDGQNTSSFVLSGSQITRWNSSYGSYYATGHAGSLYDATEKALNLTTHQSLDITGTNFPAAMIFTVIKSPQATWSNYGTPFGSQDGTRPIIFENGQTYMHSNPYPRAARKNGVDLSGNFNMTPITTKFVLSAKLQSQTSSRAYRLGGTDSYPAKMYIYELIVTDQDLAADKIQMIENYLAAKWSITGGSLVPLYLGSDSYDVYQAPSGTLNKSDVDVKLNSFNYNSASLLTAKNILIGDEKYSSASCTISNTSAQLNAIDSAIIGGSGSGIVTQTGGMVSINNTLKLSSDAGSLGKYYLAGGTLKVKTITKGNGSSTFQFTGGTLKVITVNMSLNNQGGIFSPGQSPAISTITGNYTQGGSAALIMELGGTTPGLLATNYDQLVIKGNAVLGGTLTVVTYNNFAPALGQSFQILKVSGSTTGTFSTVNLPVLGGALGWNTSNLYSTGTISVVSDPNGDSDSDGVRNADDAYPTNALRSTANITIIKPSANKEYSSSTTLVGVGVTGNIATGFSGFLAYTVNQAFETGTRVTLNFNAAITTINVSVTSNRSYTVRVGLVNRNNTVITTTNIRIISFTTQKAGEGVAVLPVMTGLMQWFDASDPLNTGTAPSSGTDITTWKDKSGGNRDAVAGSGAAATYTSNQINGKAALQFNNDYYSLGLKPDTAWTTFIVVNYEGTDPYQSVFGARSGSGSHFTFQANGLTVWSPAQSSNMNFSSTLTATHVIGSWTLNATNTKAYLNNTLVNSLTGITQFNTPNWALGAYLNDTAYQRRIVGDIAEYIYYNRVLSDTERNSVENYLAGKWGITGANLSPTTGGASTDLSYIIDSKTESRTTLNALSAKDVKVGKSFDGSLALTSSGGFSAVNGILGSKSGVTGTATLSGSSTLLAMSQNLIIGEFGTGSLTQSSGTVSVNGTITLAKEVGSAGTLIINGGLVKASKLESGKGSATLTLNGGQLTVSSINMNITNTAGTLAISGMSQVSRNYTQASGAKTAIKIGGTTVGVGVSKYGQLQVKGNTILDGVLEITTQNNFMPSTGQSFKVLDVKGSITGTFSSVKLPTLSVGVRWNVTNLYSQGILSIEAGNTKPVITGLSSVEVTKNMAKKITYTISDLETSAGLLTVSIKSISNKTVLPTENILLGGSAGSRSITLNAAEIGSAIVTINVSDGQDSTDKAFTVTSIVADMDGDGVMNWNDAYPYDATKSTANISLLAPINNYDAEAYERKVTLNVSSVVPVTFKGYVAYTLNRDFLTGPRVTGNVGSLISLPVTDNAAYTLRVGLVRLDNSVITASVMRTVQFGVKAPNDTAPELVLTSGSSPYTGTINDISKTLKIGKVGDATVAFTAGSVVVNNVVLGDRKYIASVMTIQNTVSVNGTVTLANAPNSTGTLTLTSGTLKAKKVIKGNGTATLVLNGGTIQAQQFGASLTNTGATIETTKLTTITGNLTQTSGKIRLKIRSGTDADKLVISGVLTAGGTLEVVTANAVSFAAEQSFDLLDFASRVGTFNVVLPKLPATLRWVTSNIKTTGVVSIAVSDRDSDGYPDSEDAFPLDPLKHSSELTVFSPENFKVVNNGQPLKVSMNVTVPSGFSGYIAYTLNRPFTRADIMAQRSTLNIQTKLANINVSANTSYVVKIGLVNSNYDVVESQLIVTRRAASVDPLSFSPVNVSGLSVWLDAKDVSTFTLDSSNRVNQWADKSGNNHNATQTTVSYKPPYDATQGVVGFANKFLSVDFTALANSNYTLFTVDRRKNSNANHVIGTQTADTNKGLAFPYKNGSTAVLSQYENDLEAGIPAYTTPTFNIATGWFSSGTGHRLYFNGNLIGENDVKIGFSSAINGRIGRGNLGQSYTGDIAEILVFNRALTDKEMTKIENYLSEKWKITGDYLEPQNSPQVLGIGYVIDNNQSQTLTSLDTPEKNLRIGRGFSGVATLGSGANVSVADTIIAESKTTTGSLTINGTSAYLKSDGTMIVGQYGDGKLTLTKGTAEITDTLILGKYSGSNGYLSLNGGNLQVKNLIKGLGSSTIAWTSGKLTAQFIGFNFTNTSGTLNTEIPLQVSGNFNQGENAALSLQIGPDVQGVLRVSGNMSLDGTLVVTHKSGYIPEYGTRIKILTHSGSQTGRFKRYVLPAISHFMKWSTGNLYSTGEIRVVYSDKDNDGVEDLNDAQPLNPYRTTANIVITSPVEATEFAANTSQIEITTSADVAASFRGFYAYSVNSEFTVTESRRLSSYSDPKTWSFGVSENTVYRLKIGLVSTANVPLSGVVLQRIRVIVKDSTDPLTDSEVTYLGNDDKTYTQIISTTAPTKIVRIGESSNPIMNLNGPVTAKGMEVAGKIGTSATAKFSVGVTKNMLLYNDLIVGRSGIGVFSQEGGTITVNGKIILGKRTGSRGDFTLTKGKLSVPGVAIGEGAGTFSMTGGELALLQSDCVIQHTAGQLSPGLPIGRLKLNNGYTAQEGAILKLDIAGTVASVNYDVLNVSGNINLNNATLKVVFTRGFVPSEPVTFNVLTQTGSLTGRFRSIQLPTLPYYMEWNTDKLYSEGQLIAMTADKDKDGLSDSIDPFPENITGNVKILKPISGKLFDLNTVTVSVTVKTNVGPAFHGYLAYTVNAELDREHAITVNGVPTINLVIPVANAQDYVFRATLMDENGDMITTVVPRVTTFNVDADPDHDGYGNKYDKFPLDSRDWNDSDNDKVGDRQDAYPWVNTRSTNNIEILSPTQNTVFTDIVNRVQITTRRTVATLFDGAYQYKVNEAFPVSGNAGGTWVTGNNFFISVTPNATYTVYVALTHLDQTIATESAVRRVTLRTIYDYSRDTDRDGVPDLLDLQPSNPRVSTGSIAIVSPENQHSYPVDTVTVNLEIATSLGQKVKALWGYSVNKELGAFIPTPQLHVMGDTKLDIPVSSNRLYTIKVGLYSPEGNRIPNTTMRTVQISVRGVAGAATSVGADTSVSMNSSVSKPDEQLDVDGKITIKAGAETEFKASEIGTKENGKAEVVLQDPGTKLKVNENLVLGKSSTLNIQSGAALSIANDLRTSGNIVIRNDSTRVEVSRNIILNRDAGLTLESGAVVKAKGLEASSGNIALKNNSVLLASENVTLGLNTKMSLSNGSSMQVDKQLDIAQGSVSISSANTQIVVAEDLKVGGDSIMKVEEGAQVQIGQQLITSGNVQANGAGTYIEASEGAVILGNTLSIQDGAHFNTKSLDLAGGTVQLADSNSKLNVTQNVSIADGATLTVGNGAGMTVKQSLELSGDLNIANRNTVVEIKQDFTADSTSALNLTDGARLKISQNFEMDGGIHIGPSSVINVGQTSTVRSPIVIDGHVRTKVMIIESGSMITGNGTLSADLISGPDETPITMSISGWKIAPGQSPGSTTVSGNLILDDTSGFNMEIGGSKTASIDRVIVMGNFVPNGTLTVTLLYGFVPTMNQTFKIFDWETIGDGAKFDTINLPTLPLEIDWDLSTLYQDGTVRIKRVYFDNDGDGAKDNVDTFLNDPTLITVPSPESSLPVMRGVVMWMDARKPHAESVVTTNKLQTWINLSPAQPYHLEQFESDKRPVLIDESGVHKYIRGNGTTYFRTTTSNTVITSRNAVEIFMLLKTSDLSVDQTLLNFGDNEFVLGILGGKLTLTQASYSPVSVAALGFNKNRLQMVNLREWFEDTSAKVEWFIDAQPAGSQVYASSVKDITGASRYILGAASGQGFVGDVGEVIVFNRVLTITERQALEKYLQTKWGLYSKKSPALFYGSE